VILSMEKVSATKTTTNKLNNIIQACEESGSPDLPYYVEHLQARIGVPSLIVCLDSGCGNYEQVCVIILMTQLDSN
jgi:hypothetical protein